MSEFLRVLLIAAVAVLGCSCAFHAKSPGPPQTTAAVDEAAGPPTSSWSQSGRRDPQGREALPAQAARVPTGEFLTVLIKADPLLNKFQRQAHTLFLCLYQLKDPDSFNQLAQERDGIPKLIECRRFDASVANAKQLVVQPGEELTVVRDRTEGARYLGIATGYYGLGKERVTELALLPGRRAGAPSGETIRIDLGPTEITGIMVK